MATEASDDAWDPEVWADESKVLQLVKEAVMAGTCWGSCEVEVEERRKVRARSVDNSVVFGPAFDMASDFRSNSL